MRTKTFRWLVLTALICILRVLRDLPQKGDTLTEARNKYLDSTANLLKEAKDGL